MNNSFARLIDGMNATLRKEVLSRLDDEFARGQVFGVINLLNTFKVRADWSAGFLLEQIAVQRAALEDIRRIVQLRSAKPALQTLLQRGSVGEELWQRFLRAEKEMEEEVKDVVNEVNLYIHSP